MKDYILKNTAIFLKPPFTVSPRKHTATHCQQWNKTDARPWVPVPLSPGCRAQPAPLSPLSFHCSCAAGAVLSAPGPARGISLHST